MNYFEAFEIEPSFKVDEAELRRKFYEKSREYHPDTSGQMSAGDQLNALEMSTFINNAYKTLSSKSERIRYLLELSGIEFDEGSEKVPQDFLMEVMDINEMIMEFKMSEEKELMQDIFKQLESLKSELDQSYENLVGNFDFKKAESKTLEMIKDYYLKSKYLDRIESNLEN